MAAAMIKHAAENNNTENSSGLKCSQAENLVVNVDTSAQNNSDKGKRPVTGSRPKKSSMSAGNVRADDQIAGSSQLNSGGSAPNVAQNFNKEGLAILGEMNQNINKTNEKVDDLYDYEYDTQYDVDDENYDFRSGQNDDEQSNASLNDQRSNQDSLNDDTQNTVFGKFSKTFKKSDLTSKPVDEQLAQLVNDAFREGMTDDHYQNVVKDIHRPENCAGLKETKVNPGVWSVLRQHTQMEDSKLRGIQNCFVKAACNIVKVLDVYAETFDQENLELAMNSIALLGQANKWLNCRRKEYHKKDMDPKLHHLCSASTSYTDMLYEDTIVKDIKDIQEMNKIR
ncbi:uncharacterized protein LOC123532723 [Mercenaria mercenaria]|uniref:uncharacterized protein LOC123532723 n=1 Tax=Mercenaria mercenaria TaxID=6596 RepID=UPI00234EE1E9|nr:uncharacterized protein LOC123532723 [Mercenaria mercenaria]